jgi:hypothetical protein
MPTNEGGNHEVSRNPSSDLHCWSNGERSKRGEAGTYQDASDQRVQGAAHPSVALGAIDEGIALAIDVVMKARLYREGV